MLKNSDLYVLSGQRKKKKVKVTQSCLTLCNPMQSMEFSRPEYWSWQPFPSSGDLPNPGIKSKSPMLQADSSPAEPQRKPKNTGVGSLSLLQGIFPTQGSNLGLLYCRWILYQLSHKGSPRTLECVTYPFSSGSSLDLGNKPESPALQVDSLPTELSGKPILFY